MKKITSICLLLLFVTSLKKLAAQCSKSCCESNAIYAFAGFAKEKKFRAGHDNPKPFTYVSEKGEMITFKTNDGGTAKAFAIMAVKPTKNNIIVIQEWWGLNDYIKKEAEKLQKDLGNVNVYAVDMYDGKIATNRDSAGKYMGEFKQDRGFAILSGLINYFGEGAKVGTIGWCFGGGWSLQASLLAGNKAVACVMYYGMPEESVGKLKNLNTDVLGIFAKEDKWVNPEVVDKFAKNMTAAGKKVSIKMFEADHAFANPSNPKFNKAYTEEAYQTSVKYFRERLK